jgi:hypothetical protein
MYLLLVLTFCYDVFFVDMSFKLVDSRHVIHRKYKNGFSVIKVLVDKLSPTICRQNGFSVIKVLVDKLSPTVCRQNGFSVIKVRRRTSRATS